MIKNLDVRDLADNDLVALTSNFRCVIARLFILTSAALTTVQTISYALILCGLGLVSE